MCAMLLPVLAQAQVTGLAGAAPAPGCQLSSQHCHLAGCSCPCCRQSGGRGIVSRCGCLSVSLATLPSPAAAAPLAHVSSSYAAYLAPIPKTVIFDIFRPPKG